VKWRVFDNHTVNGNAWRKIRLADEDFYEESEVGGKALWRYSDGKLVSPVLSLDFGRLFGSGWRTPDVDPRDGDHLFKAPRDLSSGY